MVPALELPYSQFELHSRIYWLARQQLLNNSTWIGMQRTQLASLLAASWQLVGCVLCACFCRMAAERRTV
jgi:hypothetical protein